MENFLLLVSFTIAMSAAVISSPDLSFSLLYFLCLGLLIITFFGQRAYVLYSLAFFTSIILALYQYHYNLVHIPWSEGFRTSGGGIPTGDDAGFLQNLFIFLEEGYFSYPFSVFVGIFTYPLYCFKQITVQDAIFFNSLGHSLCAYFVYEVVLKITKGNIQAAKIAFYSSLFNGILIYDGLSFMRDGWTATFFVMSLWAFLESKNKLCLIFILFLATIRIGSAVAAVVGVLIGLFFSSPKGRISLANNKYINSYGLVFVSLFMFVLSAPYLGDYLESKHVDVSSGYRESFVGSYQDSAEDNVFSKLLELPVVLRVPLSFLHYVFAPYIQVGYFSLMPEKLFPGIYTIWFAFAIPFILRGYYSAVKTKNSIVLCLVYSYLSIILILSNFSLQLRHKAMIYPILIILFSYGYVSKDKKGFKIGKLISIAYVLLSLFKEFMFSS